MIMKNDTGIILIFFLAGALFLCLCVVAMLYKKYRRLVAGPGELITRYECRRYIPFLEARNFLDGKQMPLWAWFFFNRDLSQLKKLNPEYRQTGFWFAECYDWKGARIQLTDDFLEKAYHYRLLLVNICLQTGGHEDRDSRSMSEAPYAYISGRIKVGRSHTDQNRALSLTQ